MKNTTLRFICVLWVWGIMILPLSAQMVTQEKAAEIARSFFAGQGASHGAAKHGPRKAPLLQRVNYSNELYIFNNVANSGYVIVSGDERMPEILGYSFTGSIDTENMPCNMKAVFENYQRQMVYLRMHPEAEGLKSAAKQYTAIAPLLGETAWDQIWPYNAMCPTINGTTCVTGCTATAMAQAMYYFKWPNKGTGTVSYEWNGQTLSADLSKSTYKWDLMKPTYNYYSSQESIDAMALLIRDVGYACHMNYGINSSGAAGQGKALIEHFSYDASIGYLLRDYCDFDTWDNTIVNELTNGRAMLYDAGSSVGAHALVIDGIDANGYYHFNWGLGGECNGYYTMKTIVFNSSASLYYGLMKDQGGSMRVQFGSSQDFLFDETEFNQSEDNYYLKCYGLTPMSVYSPSNYYTCIAIENTKTHKITYDSEGQRAVSFKVSKSLADGKYIIYPVARCKESDSWKKLMFYDHRQPYVDLTVKNGKKTFGNNNIYDGLQEGAVEVDNIFYFLDNNTHEASVTFKNDHLNSYQGDVKIPSTITVDNQKYTVTSIGSQAFFSCQQLGTVTIPKTVKRIENSFYSSRLDRIVFEKGSQLTSISGFTFQGSQFKYKEIAFPEGLTSIPMCLFQSSNITTVAMPSTVTYLMDIAYNYNYDIRTVIMNATTLPNVYGNAFTGFDLSLATLFVPKGKASAYKNADMWKDFGKIVELSDTATIDGLKYIFCDTDNSAYLMSVSDMEQTSLTIPSKVTYLGKRYSVANLCPFLFTGTKLEKLVVPSSVNYIGEGIFFDYDYHLSQLYIGNKVPPKVADLTESEKSGFKSFFPFDGMFDMVTLYVPPGCKTKYKKDKFWGKFTNIIEDASLNEGDINLGDVNDDGAVNITDVISLVNVIIGKKPSVFVEKNADMNDDGSLNITDVMEIVNAILGK